MSPRSSGARANAIDGGANFPGRFSCKRSAEELPLMHIPQFLQLEAKPRVLEVLLADLDGNPSASKTLCNRTRSVGARKGIDDKAVLLGKELDEEPGQLGREPSRVNLPTCGLQRLQVVAVALIVAALVRFAPVRTASQKSAQTNDTQVKLARSSFVM